MSTWTTPFWFPIHHHTAHLCQLGEALCNLIGDLSELRTLEDKLGVIPNDGLTVRQRNLDLHIDLRTIVQAQPAVRNHTIRDHFETHLLAARRDLIATSHFPVQDQLKFLLLGLDLQGLGELHKVLLDQGVPNKRARTFKKLKTKPPPITSLTTFSSMYSMTGIFVLTLASHMIVAIRHFGSPSTPFKQSSSVFSRKPDTHGFRNSVTPCVKE
mmetsp:Transcript_10282/g.27588  ORF Transcript_10282/g.27588 Transcript_10282/m.27588 type:complete len:213 (+) Transcript_10282:962-1600(+)